MGSTPDLESAAKWKARSIQVARRLLADRGRPDPISSHQLDQILATIRDAGLSEREQGVFLVTLIDADMDRKGWGKMIPQSQRIAVAAALALRLLDENSL